MLNQYLCHMSLSNIYKKQRIKVKNKCLPNNSKNAISLFFLCILIVSSLIIRLCHREKFRKFKLEGRAASKKRNVLTRKTRDTNCARAFQKQFQRPFSSLWRKEEWLMTDKGSHFLNPVRRLFDSVTHLQFSRFSH